MKKIAVFIFLLGFGLFFVSPETLAARFNPNYILDDVDLEDYTTMSPAQIQDFLLRKGGLGTYVATDIDGQIKTAAAIIARVSRAYRINPQFLVALLQKEQSIVEDPTPSEARLAWAAGYGVCDSCDKNHPDMQQFRGFANQLEQAAKRFRETYLMQIDTLGQTLTGMGPSITKLVDGKSVTPVNRATASFYSYTPHISGNRLLWKIWQKWFRSRYPDGSLLETEEDGIIWLIDNNKKRKIVSLSALYSRFNPELIIKVSSEELEFYNEGRGIKFPDFSLLRSPRGTVYLIRGDKKHGFPSQEVFRKLGFNGDEVIDAIWEDLNLYEDGEPLALTDAYPVGALLQDSSTGGIYYAEDDVKKPIWSKEILFKRFPGRRIILTSRLELNRFQTSEPIKFRDGELIGLRGQPDIFLVSDGSRRPIPSATVFEQMGFNWSNITWTNEKSISLHPLAEPLELTPSNFANSEITIPTPISQALLDN